MNTANNSERKFHQTIRDDLKNISLRKDLRSEYRNLSDFYLDSDKKSQLESMDTVQRWIHKTIWLLKSMFLHLTPFRRILVLAGVLFLMISRSVTFNDTSVNTDNAGLFGGILILFVLFLELKDKLLARHELEAGRKVQQALMPPLSPEFPGWSIWLFTRPANEVGGDLVDYLKLEDGKAILTIADVAGKGLKAALLAAKLQATVRALVTETDSLSDLGNKLNKIFYRDSLPSLFASMLFMMIDSDSSKISYLNAGHFPPLVIKDKEIKAFPKGDPALGLTAGTEYNEQTIALEQDEIFLAYSDGIFESRNEYGEFYGIERFYQLIKNSSGKSPEAIGRYIISQVEQFVGDYQASDDMSLIIIKKVPLPGIL